MNSNLLEGKIAFVAGASRGIGLAASTVFAAAGATVIIGGRNKRDLDEAVDSIKSIYPSADIVVNVCNVADESSVKSVFQLIFRKYKRLDILLSNAGILNDALIGMVSANQIQEVFGTNTFGALYCAQYASRLMARNNGGSIIFTSSIIGANGNIGQAVYGGSKAAVNGITLSLAKELAPQNIRVNAIAPGFIDTAMARSLTEKKFKERVASIKMGRIGRPEEVANAALFLASDLSTYVTGQIIGVDGGMLI